MEEINNKPQGFYIQDFMCELGLSGAALSLYALIYSFSTSISGLYFGSQGYAAERIGISLRSVQRAVKTLLDRGLIEKCETDGKRGYRTVSDFYKQKEETPPAPPECEANLDLYECKEYDSEEEREDYIDKSGRHISGRTDAFTDRYERLHRYNRPKYEKLSFGHEGMVALTREQYDSLRKLVDIETLNVYLTRYEIMLKEKMEMHRPWPKNAYLVLRKWIEAAHAV